MKIALDVDEVIADFFGAACDKCNVPRSDRVNHWEQPFITENWDSIAEDTEFWRKLEVINIPDFDFDIYLTSVPEHIIEHRQFWLDNNKLPKKPLVVDYDKVKIADELGIDVLIDDRPSNVRAWIDSGRIAIQYIPYNFKMPIESPYYTSDFGEIKNILKTIKQKYYGENKSKGIQDVQTRK